MSLDFLYYPGCSMDTSARAYQASLDVVCDRLGIILHELDDWNCCGATEYVSLSATRAYALIGRNLAIAERQRNDTSTLVAPCSACYLNLAKTDRYLRDDRRFAETIDEALAAGGLHYTPGSVTVRHLLDVLVEDVGLETIGGHVTRPLAGLKVAPYLGCMVPRPDVDGRWVRHEVPATFDWFLAVLGAEVVDFPLKTDCCGGHLTQISPDTGFELMRRLVHEASARGADLMATVCPMCQMNIDCFQDEMNAHFRTSYHMPILFFTQLVGLAFGAAARELGIGSELVDPRAALAKIGVEVPPPEPAAPARSRSARKSAALPMPPMPADGEREGLR